MIEFDHAVIENDAVLEKVMSICHISDTFVVVASQLQDHQVAHLLFLMLSPCLHRSFSSQV